MPDLLTPQALATAGPLVLETFFKHYLPSKGPKTKHRQAREDLMYDEAFVLMKTFLEIATKYPVAALQRFGLVRTPAPPWVALHRVLIPQTSLASAADYLITALGGPEMAYKVAGGSKWWQVRAGPGVEGEWIVMKKDWKREKSGANTPLHGGQKKKKDQSKADVEMKHDDEGTVGEDGGTDENGEFRKEMDELRCMLYIHGGAYYWGSINTHRYTIWRYARKMHGRCFAVNYRKAPQYPFPCAIQDCLAAWLYLVDPPPEAKHKPVDPKNIVLAGDSAGGGLVWALLQILRDTPGLDLPAGAVLISPWSDLTHSFPSILHNTATDIVPPYGFIHKPSSLWPPPPADLTEEIQNNLRTRVRDAVARFRTGDHQSQPPDQPASAGDLQSSLVQEPTPAPPDLKTSAPQEGAPGSEQDQKTTLHPFTKRLDDEHQPGPTGEPSGSPHRANPGLAFPSLKARKEAHTQNEIRQTTLTLCNTPMRLEVRDQPVLIDTQIQLYATNAQLCHPWVSPILGYLGGLPPLLIIAGDQEVLRDEIIYAAHKAANPSAYPIRDDVRAQMPSLNGIEARHRPTNVHLQVYDGACHDLPLFSMTKISRGLFRAIASFARYVTPSAPGSLSISKSQFASPSGSASHTPGVSRRGSGSGHARPPIDRTDSDAWTPSFVTPFSSTTDLRADRLEMSKLTVDTSVERGRVVESPRPMTQDLPAFEADTEDRRSLSHQPSTISLNDSPRRTKVDAGRRVPSGDDAGPRFDDDDPAKQDSKALPGTAGHTGIYKGENPFVHHMIRERVAIDGTCRPLEPAEELDAMTMPQDEVGMIKEGPAIRYLNGQSLWDRKYKHAIKTVERHRRKNLKNAHDRDVGKIHKMWHERVEEKRAERQRKTGAMEDQATKDASGAVAADQDWETEATDTDGETSSGSSGTQMMRKGQRDQAKEKTVEEALMDQSWSWSWALDGEAPPPSAIVSRRDFGEARQLALMADRMDTSHDSPVHGLSIWVGLAAFFSNSGERNRAHDVLKQAHQEQKAEQAGRGTIPGESPIGKGALEKGEKGISKMGRIFGLGKK